MRKFVALGAMLLVAACQSEADCIDALLSDLNEAEARIEAVAEEAYPNGDLEQRRLIAGLKLEVVRLGIEINRLGERENSACDYRLQAFELVSE